ncbi:hypothetical protein AB0B48_16950 [Micromonospora sp. NPDC049089]|uniref:hypothetical protein n=1 Tax=Micromonospora sp. NPDC049089 TaxID=3155496 RepID=UPI00340FD4DC
MLALLCLGGIATAVVWYNRASTPDRSTPDVAVINYLQATLVSRDPNRAGLFTCEGAVPSVDEFAADVAGRERDLGVSFSINIEDVAVTETAGADATVVAVIRRSAAIDGIHQSLADTWQFDLNNRDGWRVCAGSRIS